MDLSGMIDGMIKKSIQSIPQNDGDYLKDGLLYCGKCHTPKQCRIEMLDSVRTPMCLCQCEKERLDKEESEYRQREKQQELERMRSVGFPDREMLNWRFENDDNSNERLSAICKRYVQNFREMRKKGKGLLFFGPVGTGKTFLAACIANALIDEGFSCMVTNFARLSNTLSGKLDGRQEYLDSLNRYSLLVIDDLAAERNTEYMNEVVFSLIDARYRSGLPIIITTNLTAEELKHPADLSKQRVYSRLFEMCFALEVKGKDRRKSKMISDYEELKNLLEI